MCINEGHDERREGRGCEAHGLSQQVESTSRGHYYYDYYCISITIVN